MKSTIFFILNLLLVVVLAGIGYFAITLWERQIQYSAIQDCLHTGQVTFQTADGATVTQPSQEWYDICMQDKRM